MRLMVFGRTGQTGHEIQRIMPQAICLDRPQADLCDPDACADRIIRLQPDAVINAAGWTDVDLAESQEESANLVNAAAPAAMARACAKLGIPFVQISTDHVFSGHHQAAPFSPDSAPAPINAYGRSKLRGEKAVQAAGGCHAILRTSWVFSSHRHNFVKTILRLAQDHSTISVVGDQFGGPTPARDLAYACVTIARHLRQHPARSGIYHLSGTPDVSRAEFARFIIAHAGLPCQVQPVTTQQFPRPAPRPLDTRLDCSTLSVFGLSCPDWRKAADEVLAEIRGALT